MQINSDSHPSLLNFLPVTRNPPDKDGFGFEPVIKFTLSLFSLSVKTSKNYLPEFMIYLTNKKYPSQLGLTSFRENTKNWFFT